MRLSWVSAIVGLGLSVGVACSGKAVDEPIVGNSGGAGAGASAGTGGTGTGGTLTDAATCPPVFGLSGVEACRNRLPQCTTGLCVGAPEGWICSSPCPCPAGWTCTALTNTEMGCAPDAYKGCVVPLGSGGSAGQGGTAGGAGVAGFGGYPDGWGGGYPDGVGGAAGQGGYPDGWGGGNPDGWGGAAGQGGYPDGVGGGPGGSGGMGACGGDPECPGNGEATFCGESRLLYCAIGQVCPQITDCSAFCPGCTCHLAPPIGGIFLAGCDHCTGDNDCDSGFVCVVDQSIPGAGAKVCSMGM